jgi:hypothetical protein
VKWRENRNGGALITAYEDQLETSREEKTGKFVAGIKGKY